MEIKQFDDTKMCECLRSVKSCLDGLLPEGILLQQLKKIYDEEMGDDGLTLSSGIDFCLDTTNQSKNQRNMQFNYIFLSVDRLLRKMKEIIDWETMMKRQKWDEDYVFFDDSDMKTAEHHIKVADDLLQAVVAESQHGGTTRALLKKLDRFGHTALKPKVPENDVRKMKFEPDRQWTIDTYKNKWKKDAVERQILFSYYKHGMTGFRDILNIHFDVDKTFEKQCYLDGNYLCTVAHNVYGDDKGLSYPGTKSYKLVVTWPDGRTEDWKLSFYLETKGEREGQFREWPDGQKFVSEFIFIPR
jgi:hypothetical protein